MPGSRSTTDPEVGRYLGFRAELESRHIKLTCAQFQAYMDKLTELGMPVVGPYVGL